MELIRHLDESIRGVLWLTNRADNSIIYASSAYEQLWGRSLESLYASPRSWLDLIHPKDQLRVRAAASEEETTGEFDEEYRIVRADGSVRWIRDRKFPIGAPLGQKSAIAGIAEDITDRRDAQRRLRRRKAGRVGGRTEHGSNARRSPGS